MEKITQIEVTPRFHFFVHHPEGETNEVVILEDPTNQIASMPACFAYGLTALYPEMDKIGEVKSPNNLLALAAQGNGFDTWSSESPIPAQKVIRWLLGPTARWMGYGKLEKTVTN